LAYNANGLFSPTSELGQVVVGPFNLVSAGPDRFPGIPDQAARTVRVNALEGTLAFRQSQGLNQVLDAVKGPFVLCLLCTGGLSVAILDLLRRMFQSVGRGEAFTASNIRNLRLIGFSFLVSCVLKMLAAAWLLHRMTAAARLLLGTGKVVLDSATDGNWSGVAVGLVVLALAEIFRQGLALKEESLLTI
jgi:Protein of unknown function (DUF2975)